MITSLVSSLLLAVPGSTAMAAPAQHLGCTAGAAGASKGCSALPGEHLLLQRPRPVVSKSLGSRPLNSHSAPASSVVDQHGFLRVEGNRIVGSKSGQPVRLRGMSLFWSQWMPQFWNAEAVHWLRSDWNVTLVRAAMAVEHEGYLANPQAEKARIRAVVDAAIAAGIYVIIDWHDHSAERHVNASTAFFGEMAAAYGHYPNVLFEVFNEPVRQEWSTTIKPYHERLVSTIRRSSSNLVILGTRLWSQEVDEASRDPVAGPNLAYTIHFYAATHGLGLRRKVQQALANGIAVFATEWGTCDASGDGTLDLAETRAWLAFLDEHSISDANWAIGDKDEACAALRPGASGLGGWQACQLTASGAFVRAGLRGEPAAGTAPEPCPEVPLPPQVDCSEAGEDCSSTRCCTGAGQQCFRKNAYWAGCRASCTPGVDPADPPQYQSPWSCELLA